MPIDIEAYQVGSEVRYDVISVRNVYDLDWTLVRDLTSARFGDVFGSLRDTHRPVVADSSASPKGQRFSDIRLENENGPRLDDPAGTDGRRLGRQEQRGAGNRVINRGRYQTASGTRCLGIWRQYN